MMIAPLANRFPCSAISPPGGTPTGPFGDLFRNCPHPQSLTTGRSSDQFQVVRRALHASSRAEKPTGSVPSARAIQKCAGPLGHQRTLFRPGHGPDRIAIVDRDIFPNAGRVRPVFLRSVFLPCRIGQGGDKIVQVTGIGRIPFRGWI